MSEELKPRFDLLPAGPLRRCALRMAENVAKHGEGYVPAKTYDEYIAATLRHMNEVVECLQNKRKPSEDNLAAAACDILLAMRVEMIKETETIGGFETPPPPKSFTGSLTYPRE